MTAVGGRLFIMTAVGGRLFIMCIIATSEGFTGNSPDNMIKCDQIDHFPMAKSDLTKEDFFRIYSDKDPYLNNW